jgi:hypothetical protein
MDEPSPKKRGVVRKGADDPSNENERPTINPPFDVEAFARAITAPEADTSTTRPPPAKGAGREPDSDSPRKTSSGQMEAARSDSNPSVKLPFARSQSALWMVDALVPSGLPPPREPGDGSSEDVPPGVSDAPDRLAAPEITEQAVEDPIGEMRERESLGDYTGALEMADLILTADPSNTEAAQCVESCRAVLEKMYSAKLGPLDRAPIVVVPRAQLRWLSIDHRAGFILSLIDGTSPIEMIIDVSGMPKMDALRILHELVQQRIVSFKT